MSQWLLPFDAMNDLGRGFLVERPLTGLLFSRSMGPDWRRCVGGFFASFFQADLRVILALFFVL